MDIYNEDDLSEYDSNPSDLLDFEDEIDYETENFDLEENYLNCILPTLEDTFQNFLFTILTVNITLKVVLILNDSLNLKWKKELENLIKILGGLYLIYDFFREAINIGNYLVLTIFIGTILTFSTSKFELSSKYIWLFCLSILLTNEFLILFSYSRFKRLRAIVILLIMKFISLIDYLELKSKEKKVNFLDCLTYILHPQCLPLGGWNPVNFNPVRTDQFTIVRNFVKYSKPFLLSLFFLLLSNCLIAFLMSLIETVILPLIYFNSPTILYFMLKGLLNAYFVALQFRCSHYFISYTMQYIHYLWGYNVQVTKPLSLEFPRSLVEVVIVWNLPMHEWLKNHLYKKISINYGNTSSRFLTFIISSLMHGYDFRVWSVLITLACLTWIEMRLRKKLSIKLNACIDARVCNHEKTKDNSWLYELFKSISTRNYSSNFRCKKHDRTPYNSLIVNLINLIFSVLCVVHLAFLGSAFDGKEENSTFQHVHQVWSFLSYYSIILFVPTFLIYKLV